MATPRTGRPRGRPPGVKNKPKTLEAFVLAALEARPSPPPRKPKRKAAGPWTNLDAEGRKALSAKLIAARKGKNGQGIQPPTRDVLKGKPLRLDEAQWVALKASVQPEIKRIIKKMKEAGQIGEDPRAEQVLSKTLETFLTATTPKDISSLGRLLLDFTKAKPAAKVDVSVRTHEDFLDEIAEDHTPG